MRLLLLLAMVLSLSSCAKEDDGNMGKFSKPDTLPQKFSYVYGFLLAEAAADYRDMDYSQVIHGISDYSYSSPEFSAPEMNDILTRYQQLLLAEVAGTYGDMAAAIADTDTGKLEKILCEIATGETGTETPQVIRCAWQQIGEDGRPFSVSVQDRIFRNIPEIRYHGRIHEQISLPGGEAMICQDEQKRLSISHTGYVPAIMKEKKKWLEEYLIWMKA